ncbi:MAG: 4-(cytidine 5'-diphospho)-2-C-methyl-D-erythritol kinase [Rhodanobacteraceae bacterium]
MNAGGWSSWPAPAKLNLFLHIVGRRSDGYHLIQTCFQLLDWGDQVHLRVRDDGALRHHAVPDGISADEELGMRAAAALRAATGCRRGVDIAIDKRIPLGGGLGGGSSDAATVLIALNAIWATGVDENALSRIALDLGADVPVFVRGHSAWAQGIGEELTPLALPERWYLVVDPGVSVPTAQLFNAAELTRNTVPLTIRRFLSGAATGNAFEPLARARFPQVARVLDWLSLHGDARLSGSGASAFLPVASRAAGAELARRCPSPFRCHLVRGVARSPLLDRRDAWSREAISVGASPSW